MIRPQRITNANIPPTLNQLCADSNSGSVTSAQWCSNSYRYLVSCTSAQLNRLQRFEFNNSTVRSNVESLGEGTLNCIEP